MKLTKIAKVFNCYRRVVCSQTAERLLGDKQPYQMYRIIVACVAMFMGVNVFAAPYVTNVVAKQRYPWNGLVDVKYEIVGSTNGMKCVYSTLKAIDKKTGKEYSASTFMKPLDLKEGKNHAIWDMSADVELVSTNVVFSVIIESPALYLVVDLSAGKNATMYPVSELSVEPEGGWTDEYKTTKLVLRLIEPGAFKMNGVHDITLTNPYYIGVFEVTQKQYELVTGKRLIGGMDDKASSCGIMWNEIRGDSSLYNWPMTDTVLSTSFIGLLQRKTGLVFDIPTEAQWEYACRAGASTKYYWGDLFEEGYANYNSKNEAKIFVPKQVGTLKPNSWGLYDMIGNVAEWCLDWFGDLYSGDDPKGPLSGAERVLRGGSCNTSSPSYLSSSSRSSCNPGYTTGSYHMGYGFRIVRILAK